MARQVLPWVGAAVGAYFGNPQLGFMIGSMIGNAVDPQVIKGPALGEGQNNTASEGGYRPIVLGKGAVGVCMIHQGPEIIRTIRHRQSKGGGPVTEEQRRYRTMAFALGESAYPETGVQLLRLWFDNKLVYDVTPTSQIVAESADFAQRFTFYPGNETQDPDPDLEAMPVDFGGGVGNVPSYRGGYPYIVLPEYDVTDGGGRAPMIKAELATFVTSEPYPAWIMAAGFNNSAELKLAPAFDDWSQDAFRVNLGGGQYWFPGTSNTTAKISRAGSEIIAFAGTNDNGPDVIFSSNNGADGSWSTVAMSSPGLGAYECVKLGPLWWIPTGSAFNAHSFDGVTATPQSWQASSICVAGGSLFSIQSLNYYLIDRGSGSGYSEIPLDIPSGYTTDALLASDGANVLIMYSYFESIGLAKYSGGAACTPLPNPFTVPPGNYAWLARYSRELELWVVVCNTQIAYGPSLEALQLSDFEFPSRPSDLKEDGERFLVCGPNRLLMYSTDGNVWSTVTPSPTDTNIGTVLKALSTVERRDAPLIGNLIPLSSIATWIHERVNIPAGKYNVVELTDMVEGVVFADGYTGASAMQSLMALYFFDAGEFDAGSGYKLNYVKRGKPAVMTLTEDDIAEGPEDWEREDSFERPRVLHVQYPNPVADYGAPNIVIKRTSPDVLIVGERSASVPVVFSDVDEITRRADVMMTVIYTEIAGTYKLVLPWSLLTLAPTDVIGFSIRGRTRRLRMDQWRFSPDGTISTEFLADRQSAWTSNVTGLQQPPSKPPPPSIVGPTASAVLDIPALADNLDSLHLIVAASGLSPAWYGADHQRKLPSDADYSTMLRFSGVTTIMGALQADVTAASAHFTDTTNIVRVKLYRDEELLTYTQEQFLSENGAFALSWMDSGVRRWEICQYRDAVKVGDAEWELTTLQRGRLNTAAAEHPTGSLFVLLDEGVRAMPMQSPMLGQDITHRAVSLGQLPDQAVPYTEPYTGESQREWPVASLVAGLNGDDLEVAWIPRHRFGTDDAPIASQNWRGYRVSATDGVNTLTAETTVEGHTFDVAGWSTPITVSVSQINRITGEGPAVTEEVA